MRHFDNANQILDESKELLKTSDSNNDKVQQENNSISRIYHKVEETMESMNLLTIEHVQIRIKRNIPNAKIFGDDNSQSRYCRIM